MYSIPFSASGRPVFEASSADTTSNFRSSPVIRSTTLSSVATLPRRIGLKKTVAPGVIAVTS